MKHTNYCTLLLLLCSLSNLHAQWLASPAPAANKELFKASFVNAQVGYTMSSDHIYKTTNGGQTWTEKYYPGQISGSEVYFFNEIHFVTEQIGFVVGWDFLNADYLILRTDNGGNGWTPYTYEQGFSIGECNDLDFPNPLTGYVAGDQGLIFKTTNGGSSWQVSSTPGGSDNELVAIDFVNDQTGFVLSLSNQKLFKTTNGAASWTSISLPTAFRNLQFFTTQTGIAEAPDGLFKTTDGGQNWVRVGEVFTSGLNFVQFTDPNTGFAWISNGPVKTVDGGLTWYRQAFDFGLPPGANAGVSDIAAVDDQNAFACGYKNVNGNLSGFMAKTGNGGGLGVYFSLSSAQLACPGDSVTATPVFLGNPGAIDWYLDDTLKFSGAGNPTFSNLAAGPHTIRVEASVSGNAVSMTRNMSVNAGPVYPGVTFTLDAQPCLGTQAKINTNWNTANGKIVIYNGNSFIDTAIILSGQPKYFLLPEVTAPTVFTIKSVYTACGLDIVQASVEVIPKALPNTDLAIVPPQPVYCEPQNGVTIITLPITEQQVSYRLFHDGLEVGVKQGTGGPVTFNSSKAFAQTTYFWVRAASLSTGCVAYLNDTLVVPVDITDARFATTGLNLPLGTPVQISFEGTPAASYAWDFGQNANPATSTAEQPGTIVYNGAVNTVIKLVTTGPWGCQDSFTRNIALLDMPVLSKYWAMEMNASAQSYGAGNSLSVDAAGNVIVNGYLNANFNTATIPSRAGAGSVVDNWCSLLKYNQFGVLQWHVQQDGEYIKLNNLQFDPLGNAVGLYDLDVFGFDTYYYFGSTDERRHRVKKLEKMVIAKWDPAGKLMWLSEVFNCEISQSAPIDMTIDELGNIHILGKLSNSSSCGINTTTTFLNPDSTKINLPITNAGYYLARLSPEGFFQSIKPLVDAAGVPTVYPLAIGIDAEHNIYIGGSKPTLLAKYSPAGNLLWKIVPETINTTDTYSAEQIATDALGNTYISGKFNKNLKIGAFQIFNTSSGTGGSLFVAKIDASGQALWLKASTGTGTCFPTSIALHDNNLYVGSTFTRQLSYGSVTLQMSNDLVGNNGAVWFNLAPQSGDPKSYLALTEQYPSFNTPTIYRNYGHTLETDSEGNLHLTGSNGYRVNLADTLLEGRTYMFLAKIDGFSSLVGTTEILPGQNFQAAVWPNPSAGSALLIIRAGEGRRLLCQLTDAQGRSSTIFNEYVPEGQTEVFLAPPPPGVYFLNIRDEHGQGQTLKWVVE
ncbi:MAG: T9SS type A sorting domain-containing protein [Chitinophagales bacterium]|nr:T9SS type A sorting domain-containing protein [Chitinophagales bacterium]